MQYLHDQFFEQLTLHCHSTYSKCIVDGLSPFSAFVMAADDLLDGAGGDEDVLQQLLQLFQSQPAVRQHFHAAMGSLLNKLLCIFRSCQEICNNFSLLGENVDISLR